jgi:hypothetical protein
MRRSPNDGVRLEVTFCLFCNLFPGPPEKTNDLKPPEIRAAFLFCNILPCPDFTVGYDYAVEGLTEKEKAIAAVVILGLNVGLGIVLSRLNEAFFFFCDDDRVSNMGISSLGSRVVLFGSTANRLVLFQQKVNAP